MTSHTYYIRLGGNVRGPYSVPELKEQMAAGRFSLDVYEVSADRKSWQPATDLSGEFPDMARPRPRLAANRSQTAPMAVIDPVVETSRAAPVEAVSRTALDSEETDWHVSIDGQPLPEPLPHSEVERRIRAGVIRPSDLVWQRGWNTWMPIRETEWARCLADNPPARDVSVQAISSAIAGGVGYFVLLICTVILVLRMRRASLVFSENLGVLISTGVDLAIGIGAVVVGHLAIRRYRQIPGSLKERNVIVFGLSCGYTVLIVGSLLLIVAALSGSNAATDAATDTATLESADAGGRNWRSEKEITLTLPRLIAWQEIKPPVVSRNAIASGLNRG